MSKFSVGDRVTVGPDVHDYEFYKGRVGEVIGFKADTNSYTVLISRAEEGEADRWFTEDELVPVHDAAYQDDVVNSPQHYRFSNGAQVIDITENLNFNRGNVVKYVCRAGRKNKDSELEDLRKAEFYLKREIARLTND